jgi:uncharacterized protein
MSTRMGHMVMVAALLVCSLAGCRASVPETRLTPISGNAPALRLITTTGDAEVRVVPDEVVLTLGVETSDLVLDVAKKQNDDIVKKVFALAQGRGVEPKYIQTDYISIEPRYQDNYEKRDFLGFFVRKSIVITLKDISKFEDLLSSALGAGVNYVQGIDFRTTELRKHRDEARALAIKAASEKANALAKELGQQVGSPQTIREDQNEWWSSYSSWWGRWATGAQNVVQNAGGSAAPGPDETLAPGQITVNAKVTVSFELR